MEDGGNLADFGEQRGKLVGEDGLDAVGKGFFGLVMDFDEEAIGANGDGGAGKRENFVALAGTVRGIDEDGEVAAFFDGGNDRQVQGVAGEIGEGAHAAFAEHHVVVAFGKDVLGGHEELVERGGHAALEEDGLFGTPCALEQREVLHVASADLDDVGIFLDEVERFVIDGFGDDAKTEVFADVGEDLEAVKTEALEGVRRGARLVGSAAEEVDAGGLELLGDGEALLFGFDGARTSNDGEMRAADENFARWSGNANDRVFFLNVAGNEFVGLGDRDAFDHAGHGFENAEINSAGISSDANGGATGAGDGMSF